MKIRFNILFLILVLPLIVAAQVSLRVQAPRQVVEGRKFSVTFRLSNASSNAPSAPTLNNCKFVYGPSTSTMSSTQIINGQVSSSTSIDFTFTYLAEKAGEVTIPEVSVNADGKKVSSAPARFTILPPDKNAQQNQGGYGAPAVDDISTHTPRKISSDDMFVRINLSKASVYEQEAVIATMKVYTKYNISSFRATAQPTFEGFLSEELDVPNQIEQEHYNGQNYTTAVLKRCILYPQKTGNLTITSGKFEVTIVQYELVSNGFFQTRRPVEQQVITQSNNATLHVVPLPEPRPASFNGAVGQFSASASMSPTELRTNEASTYTFNVKGTGNIKYLKTPTIDFPAGIDQYTPKTDIDARFAGNNISGSYQVVYTLVPQEPGKFDIPAWDFTYFNPSTKEYVTIPVGGYEMKVAQGASTSAITEQTSIKKEMTDILHIKSSASSAQQKMPSRIFHSATYWLLYIGAAAALVAVILIYRRNLKLRADVRGRKLARANRVAAKRLRAARRLMSAHQSEQFYGELSRALWGYISDKLGIPASQLLRDNIAERLGAYGVSSEATAEIISILDDCEMARFTPGSSSDEALSNLYDKAVTAIKSVEDSKK